MGYFDFNSNVVNASRNDTGPADLQRSLANQGWTLSPTGPVAPVPTAPGNFPTGTYTAPRTTASTSTSTSTYNSAAAAQARANAQAAAEYDQSIRNTQAAIDRLGGQLNSGYSGIDSSWTNAINQLNAGKDIANRNYNENTNSTKLDYVTGKNTIGANAGKTLNSLQRLLGSRGAGGSSTSTIAAPGLVARNATLQRTDLGNTFGQNIKKLDQGWNDYLNNYNNQVSGVNTQRENQRAELARSIENNRASLLQTLAQLAGQKAKAAGGNAAGAAQPYLDQANAVLNSISNYVVKPIDYKVNPYVAPDLSKYIVNPNAAPTVQGQAPGNDYVSPYLAGLLGKKQTNTAATPAAG